MSLVETVEPAPPPARFARRKEAIVRAAVEVLNRKGVRGMTLAEVAAKLDLVPTAVSYYFKRKEDLAAAALLGAVARFDALIDAAATEPTAEGSVRRFLAELADYLRQVKAGLAEPVATFNDVRTIRDPAVDAAYTDMFRRVRRAFHEQATGPLQRQERNARAHLLLSQSYWAMMWINRYDPADYGRMLSRMADILLGGLAAPGSRWSPRLMPAPETPSDTGEVSREAFLRAATELINEEGYVGASVTKISARLNVTKGSFYHHNSAKDDLIGQCFDRTLTILRRAQEEADRSAVTGLDNIALLAGSLVHWQLTGDTPLLRTSALTAGPEGLCTAVIARFEQVSARLASVISDGIADGSIRPVDAGVAAQMLTAAINAAAELHHWTPELEADQAVEAYVRPLFLGLFKGRAG